MKKQNLSLLFLISGLTMATGRETPLLGSTTTQLKKCTGIGFNMQSIPVGVGGPLGGALDAANKGTASTQQHSLIQKARNVQKQQFKDRIEEIKEKRGTAAALQELIRQKRDKR